MKIAIISGKGGSGKSSITAAFIDINKNVIAIDCDVDASNLPILFAHKQIREEWFASGYSLHIDEERCNGCGICVKHCAFKALKINEKGKVYPQEFMCEGCGFCVRMCPQQALHLNEDSNSLIRISSFEHGIMIHGDLYPGDDNSGKMIARMREVADDEMKRTGICLQILDGPPGIGCPVLSTVTGMDNIVIVCEPTLSGISDLKRAYNVASSYCKNINVIINKYDMNETNRNNILIYCKKQGIRVIGEVPFDKKIVEAQLHCQSIMSYAPNSPCSEVLRQAYSTICNKKISELTE